MSSKKRGREFRKQLKIRLYPVLAQIVPRALRLLNRLSLTQIDKLSRFVAQRWYRISTSSRTLGLDNLELIYKTEFDHATRAELLQTSIANAIKGPLEFFHYTTRQAQFRQALIIADSDRRRLEDILKPDRGAVILTAHLGNCELLNAALRQFAPISIVSRHQKEFDQFVTTTRADFDVNTEHDHLTSAQQLVNRLQHGELVEIVQDRNVSHAKGVVVPFMGQPAFTPYFAVNLALHAGVPIIPAFLFAEGRNYRLVVQDAIEISACGNKTETYIHYCTRFNQAIGQAIQAHPEQWFWAHKRWARPKGEVREA